MLEMASHDISRNLRHCASIKRKGNSSIRNTINLIGRLLSTETHTQQKDHLGEEKPVKTALYNLHLKYGSKMIDFCGYSLPIQYNDATINSSHHHTRSNCSIFDVSHMLQTNIYGKHAIQFLESLCVTDIARMKNNQSALSLFTIDKTGGILDDFIITKIADDILHLVSNASRQTVDKELLTDRLIAFNREGKDVMVEFVDSEQQSLIAVQGPKSAHILQSYVDVNLQQLYFMNSSTVRICGVDGCRITRCGYTGEDGVEISIPSKHVSQIVENLMSNEFVKLAGLGARDTLRLESGLCLYGNDINSDVTPVEAGLAWTIGKRRLTERGFPGWKIIVDQIKNGVNKKRVGIVMKGGPAARTGTKIVGGLDKKPVGQITSGCPSPSLGSNIAMGYINSQYSTVGNDVLLEIRGKLYNATVCRMPFVQVNYYTKPKKSPDASS